MNAFLRTIRLFAFLVAVSPARADEAGWIDLTRGPKPLGAFAGKNDDWVVAGDAAKDATNPRRLTARPGEGVLAPRSGSGAENLVTRQRFADVEVRAEFLIAQGSNSGVKLMGLYEIQIADSHAKKTLTGSDCGGVYPRGEQSPLYHVIDKGTPPRVNAARPAGAWQELGIVFRAPRFGADGRKTANARFVKVTLNGQTIHENVELFYPTGSAWRLSKEVPAGPLLLQGDHGPVAFRNVRVRPVK